MKIEKNNWVDELPAAITVCDIKGKIILMNNKSMKTFENYGGSNLLGKNVLDCHPEKAKRKLKKMLISGKTNCYTIEKKGIKKLIYQTPWFKKGKVMGIVEFSINIPNKLPNFKRD